MSTRTITVELTEAQYRALAGAVALAEAELGETGQRVDALLRAWRKINHAWHAR